ncbi:GNAT family N-acetyltransferase [Candidatus Poribacteria bacterium]|nr:GNAT family N-acetyltransferase [Candidatus Poribacteria bacterium]
MLKPPILHTERLLLRPFLLEDASEVQRLAGDRDIAANTAVIPHPYEEGMAEEWIRTHRQSLEDGTAFNLAIILKDNVRFEPSDLIGAIGITIDTTNRIGELGFWIGKPYWNKGYCTEAAKEILKYGLDEIGLKSIHAFHLGRNPASGRVLQKIGMKYEDSFPNAIEKWGKMEDLIKYNMLCDVIKS